MMTLGQARRNIGRTVIYARWDTWTRTYAAGPERGVITEVGAAYVFVRYGDELNSKATSPDDLTLETR